MLVGWKITLISPYEQKEPHENIKFVKLDKVANSVDVVSIFGKRNFSTIEMIKYRVDASRDQVDFAFSDDNMQKILKTEEKFDLFMLDVYLNDALLGWVNSSLNDRQIYFNTFL